MGNCRKKGEEEEGSAWARRAGRQKIVVSGTGGCVKKWWSQGLEGTRAVMYQNGHWRCFLLTQWPLQIVSQFANGPEMVINYWSRSPCVRVENSAVLLACTHLHVASLSFLTALLLPVKSWHWSSKEDLCLF